MRLRHLLAASAVTVGLALVPGTAQAATVDCGTVDALEVVTPPSRSAEHDWARMQSGLILDDFRFDVATSSFTWSAHEGNEIHRIIIEAGRRQLVLDAPEQAVVVDSDREVLTITFCGTSANSAQTPDSIEIVELAPAIVIEVGDALVVERQNAPVEIVPVEAAPAPAAPVPAVTAAPVLAPQTPIVAAPVVAAAPAPTPPTPAPAPVATPLPSALDRGASALTAAQPTTAPAATHVDALPVLAIQLAAAPVGPQPLPVGTMEFVVLTCLGMITFSATSRLPSGRRRR